MRWLYIAVIVLFAAATLIFAAQNFETVTISFFRMNLSLPLAVQTLVVYLLGAATMVTATGSIPAPRITHTNSRALSNAVCSPARATICRRNGRPNGHRLSWTCARRRSRGLDLRQHSRSPGLLCWLSPRHRAILRCALGRHKRE